MKASMKRIIILFLVCGLICVGSLKAQAASLSQKEMDEVTRIEWLKALTETFEMTVEEDNYPDNYYSDMDSSSENYYEVMLATEFGLVDVEAGDPLRPDEPATREFVAHTINLCICSNGIGDWSYYRKGNRNSNYSGRRRKCQCILQSDSGTTSYEYLP